MPATRKIGWPLIAGVFLVLTAGVGSWGYLKWANDRAAPSSNAIMVIAPYWYNGTRVFDDPA